MTYHTSGGGWGSDAKEGSMTRAGAWQWQWWWKWLKMTMNNDDEDNNEWWWMIMMVIMMFSWYFFYLTRQCRRQKTLFLDNWRRSPGIVWLSACFLLCLKWFWLFLSGHDLKVWFWTFWRRGWDSLVQGRSSHGEKVPSGSVFEIRLIYVSKMCYNQIAFFWYIELVILKVGEGVWGCRFWTRLLYLYFGNVEISRHLEYQEL